MYKGRIRQGKRILKGNFVIPKSIQGHFIDSRQILFFKIKLEQNFLE